MKETQVCICTKCGHVERHEKRSLTKCPQCRFGFPVWTNESTAAKIMTGLFRLGREGGEKK